MGPLHVLVVESKAESTSRVVDYLAAAPERYVVRRVGSLESALATVYVAQVDLVIADLALPEARGLDAVRILRDQAAELPLIVCGASLDDPRVLAALRLGAQDAIDPATIDAVSFDRVVRFACERQRHVERIAQRARCDSLTHLHNAASFRNRLRQAIARAKRNERVLGVLYLDLDGFKDINDRFGHAAGDRVLREVADRLVASVRENDTVGRLGGDELAVLLEDIDDLADAEEVASRAQQRISEPVAFGTVSVIVTASLGIALYPGAGSTASELIAAADDAMYSDKRARQRAMSSRPHAS